MVADVQESLPPWYERSKIKVYELKVLLVNGCRGIMLSHRAAVTVGSQ
jgi:hypothetical protein